MDDIVELFSGKKQRLVKYIFLDVIRFTQDRSVEAQTDIIAKLNEIVRASVEEDWLEDNTIFLPTGDGICVCLHSIDDSYDIHLKVALDILANIHKHNEKTEDEMRKFQIRIGINENIDNLVKDINGNRNVAGAGINTAQRIMSFADGGQVLVGDAVFEVLRHREEYMNSFKTFESEDKHGNSLQVHQFLGKGYDGLNIDTPSNFRRVRRKLSKIAAYYFAHAVKNEKFFIEKKDYYFSGVVLLWFLASDSLEESETSKFGTFLPKTFGAEKITIEEQYDYYDDIEKSWIVLALYRFVVDKHLSNYYEYFVRESGTTEYTFVSSKGKEKLKKEWPGIWKEFGLDSEGVG